MKQILNKPYQAIWWSIPIILGLSLLGFKNTIDLQMHDTYFVVSYVHIRILIAVVLGITGFVYWLVRKKRLTNWMTFLHVAITISTLALILIVNLVFQVNEGDLETFKKVNPILLVLVLMALSSQLIFMANLARTLLI